ncbi:zinc finger HIT domain-containing protein 3 [Phlebotomus papatasi]|uniref:zinc finger HIT domain-containing protein 3 n=1 Tax=Phlebotomus papatasi TaxID=29031 RepID=UPI00248357EC|nr:zinc finger HIT domain-containing protein 3 [Phlebotomus papatasi]
MERKVHNCIVCEENPGKYKCSTCEIPYCSVGCWKVHQEMPCEKSEKLDGNEKIPERRTILFPTEDTIPEERLEMLKSSEELKNLLKNPHLRKLLMDLDSAENAEKAMKAAMQEPLFTEFADEALKIVEPGAQEDIT